MCGTNIPPSRGAAQREAGAAVVDGDEAHAGHGGQRGADLGFHLAALQLSFTRTMTVPGYLSLRILSASIRRVLLPALD